MENWEVILALDMLPFNSIILEAVEGLSVNFRREGQPAVYL